MSAPSISGDAFAGNAYAGKSLHVAVESGTYTVWTNDGDAPIARCVDTATAHLLAAAPDLLEALIGVLRVADRATQEFDAARAALAKAGL